MKVTRSYKIVLRPNRSKHDTSRYLILKFNEYVNVCLGKLFFNPNSIKSTQGYGKLFNQAQHKAKSILSSQAASHKVIGNKLNVPYVENCGVPVKYEISKNISFDYIVKVTNQFTKRDHVKIPAKSHKALNKALKEGWSRTNFGELKLIKDKIYLIIFVQKEVDSATPKNDCIGVDVGIRKSITRSDGYKGCDLGIVIKRFKEIQAERNGQRIKFNKTFKNKLSTKTRLKQLLDIEAKLTIARCLEDRVSLVVESRRVLSNLKGGRLSLWARNYFANRCEVLCRENSIFMIEVSPYMSSQTCSYCGSIGDRSEEKFVCKNTICSEHLKEVDADFNASRELRNRGRRVLIEKIIPIYNNKNVENFL